MTDMIAKKMLDAMTHRGKRFFLGLIVGRASYCHSVAYGLSRIEALQGAIEICLEYWQKPSK